MYICISLYISTHVFDIYTCAGVLALFRLASRDLWSETMFRYGLTRPDTMAAGVRHRHIYMHACMHAYKHTYIHACTQTYIHSNNQTTKHTYIQANIHAYIYIRFHSQWPGACTQGRASRQDRPLQFHHDLRPPGGLDACLMLLHM